MRPDIDNVSLLYNPLNLVHSLGMISLEDIFIAYYDCRKSKRNTTNSIRFEINYESFLVDLWRDINNRTHESDRNICFVVTKPKPREIFAADFKDRVVHHYIFNKLNPYLERWLVPHVFNCRKGKGTLYGLQCLESDIKTCSLNYTRDCWIAKCDLMSFFMSMDKQLMCRMLNWFIRNVIKDPYEQEDLIYLCNKTVMFRPQENCYKKSPEWMWKLIPKHKSLFTINPDKGLPIGNLSSQMFANLYLSFLDNFITKTLGFRFYGRYVDDFYIISEDKEKLLKSISLIREFLEKELLIKLHPKKFYFQHYKKGVEFTGGVVKPYRTNISNRTLYNYSQSIDRLSKCTNLQEIVDMLPSVNSYLGAFANYRAFKKRVFELTKLKGSYFATVGQIKYKRTDGHDKLSVDILPEYKEGYEYKVLKQKENIERIRKKKERMSIEEKRKIRTLKKYLYPKNYVFQIDRKPYSLPVGYVFDIDKKPEKPYPDDYVFQIDKPSDERMYPKNHKFEIDKIGKDNGYEDVMKLLSGDYSDIVSSVNKNVDEHEVPVFHIDVLKEIHQTSYIDFKSDNDEYKFGIDSPSITSVKNMSREQIEEKIHNDSHEIKLKQIFKEGHIK